MIPFCEKQEICNYLDYIMSLKNRQRAVGMLGSVVYLSQTKVLQKCDSSY